MDLFSYKIQCFKTLVSLCSPGKAELSRGRRGNPWLLSVMIAMSVSCCRINTVISAFIVKVLEMLSHFLVSFGDFFTDICDILY